MMGLYRIDSLKPEKRHISNKNDIEKTQETKNSANKADPSLRLTARPLASSRARARRLPRSNRGPVLQVRSNHQSPTNTSLNITPRYNYYSLKHISAKILYLTLHFLSLQSINEMRFSTSPNSPNWCWLSKRASGKISMHYLNSFFSLSQITETEKFTY